MDISDLMRITGVSRKALYLYESKGLLAPSRSGKNRYREYSDEDLQRLKIILKLRQLDVPLSIVAKILSNPENADLYLQACMEEKKRAITNLFFTMGQLAEIIRKMPPNGSLDDFIEVADAAFSEEQQKKLMYKIQQDYPHEYKRRILMNSFEAFLDRPLDTLAKREIWQQILDLNEKVITQEVLDGYAYFYGTYSTEELEQDFLLRREYVISVLKYQTEQELQEKAAEIIQNALNTVRNPELLLAWEEYYQLFMLPMLKVYDNDMFTELINKLSQTMKQYMDKFRSINVFFEKMLVEKEGQQIIRGFGSYLPRGEKELMYFDFYNQTYCKIVQKRNEVEV